MKDTIKKIFRKTLKILFIIFVSLFFLIGINNCSAIQKGKKVNEEELINTIYINDDKTKYLFFYENKGQLNINDDENNLSILFKYNVENGVINCDLINSVEEEKFSFVLYSDDCLYCRKLNEMFYKVIVEV